MYAGTPRTLARSADTETATARPDRPSPRAVRAARRTPRTPRSTAATRRPDRMVGRGAYGAARYRSRRGGPSVLSAAAPGTLPAGDRGRDARTATGPCARAARTAAP